MANGYFERGEIYWVKFGDSMGSEVMAGRPGVIISSDKGNNSSPCVCVAMMTTQQKNLSINVYTCVNGTRRWVLCNQILTVDKTRLNRYEGKLSPREMKELDDALEEVFDLGYTDEAALKAKDSEIADLGVQINDLKTEMAGAAAEVSKRDEEIASLKMEIEMWQKCYGRCMDMLVDVKVNADLRRRTVTPPAAKALFEQPPVEPVDPPEPPKQPDPPKDPEPVEEQDNRLDVNNCTATALKKIGFSLAMARKIVEARPFKSVEDLKRVNGLKGSQYRIMEPKLRCNPMVAKPVEPKVEFVKDEDPGYEVEQTVVVEETPVEPVVAEEPVKKVDINTATAQEINEITGIHISTCHSIVGYRTKNGPYKKLEDLLSAHGVYPGTLEKCWDKITIDGVPAEKPKIEKPVVQHGGLKVNVNTATSEEIAAKTGMSKTVAFGIVGKRKREGLYKSLNDLLNGTRFTQYHLDKYGPMLEV